MITIFLLTLLGLIVGTISGLLGVGGGILMVPAMVFVLPFWGIGGFDIHQASGVSALQSLLSGITSVITHFRRGAVVPALVYPLIWGGLLGGFTGGYISAWVPQFYLYLIFAVVLAVTLISTVILPTPAHDSDSENSPLTGFAFWPGFCISGVISFISANIGIGGSVLLLPILIYLKKVPVRIAIGTGASLVVITALSAVIGKWLTHQVPMPAALWVSLGAMVGGTLGARLSHKLSTTFLQQLLSLLMLITLVRIIYEMILIF